MASRSGEGQGGTPRVPLRGFAKLFRELDTSVRAKLESAFEEAEQLFDFHSRTVPERLNRRRISGLVAVPTITAESSILGASVRWDRVDDVRISEYEVQLSDDNVFSAPETFHLFDTFFGIEGLEGTKFVRVRAVRGDGLTGNWSNTGTLTSTTSAPVTSSVQFYQWYKDPDGSERAEPELDQHYSYSGEAKPSFYTLFEHTFTPTKIAGGMAIFGYISNRLKTYRSSRFRPWDRVRFSINGIPRMEQYFAHWTDAFDLDGETTGVLASGDPVGFYGRGGYTAAFGPYFELYPAYDRGDSGDTRYVQSFYSQGFGITWSKPANVIRPARWDDSMNRVYQSPTPTAEASIWPFPFLESSEYLKCQDFDFQVPSDATITGVEVNIKRRQHDFIQNPLYDDLGFGSPLHDLESGGSAVQESDVVEDEAYGGLLVGMDNPADDAQRAWSNVGNTEALDVGDNWTIAFHYRLLVVPSIGDDVVLTQVGTVPGDGSDIGIYVGSPTITGDDEFNIRIVDDGGTGAGISIYRYNAVFRDLILRHCAVTWDGSTTTLTLYMNGSVISSTSESHIAGGVNSMADTNGRDILLGRNESGATATAFAWPMNMGQWGMWNTTLTPSEIAWLADQDAQDDLRVNNGDYLSSDNLKHYYFAFPQENDIRDASIVLIDSDDVIRTDLENRAITTESWPELSDFEIDGTAAGIPHDSTMGIGYQSYGGIGDLWGATLTPSNVNNFYFGVAIAARNVGDVRGAAFIDHVKMTVYFYESGFPNTVTARVEAEAANEFYFAREVFAGLFNSIESGIS